MLDPKSFNITAAAFQPGPPETDPLDESSARLVQPGNRITNAALIPASDASRGWVLHGLLAVRQGPMGISMK